MNNYYELGVRVLADEMEAGGALSLCGVGATLDSEGVLDMGWQVQTASIGSFEILEHFRPDTGCARHGVA